MQITLKKPDDYHVHLRDDLFLAETARATARCFARAIVMPNLREPVTTVESALSYKTRIESHIPKNISFTPLMTLYLTDQLTEATLTAAKHCGFIHGVKLYPAHATTNANHGITDLQKLDGILKYLELLDLPLLIHGEISHPSVDIFDREARFVDEILAPWSKKFPKLRMILEHVSTAHAVSFIESAPKNIAATITAHHLMLNRNDLLAGGIRPHHYCLPVVKRETDRQALIKAATSGSPKFFLGTDSAPHAQAQKESACGCAGIYTAPLAIELYAEIFEAAQALNRLEDFASRFGAEFYGLPLSTETITLTKQAWTVPKQLSFGDTDVIPFKAGETLSWKLV